MATVKIGKELREAVLKKAKELFTIKQAKLREEMVLNKDYGQRVYNIIMSPYLPIIAQLPQGFFRQVEELNFSIEGVTFPHKFSVKQPWFFANPKNNLIIDSGYYVTDVKLSRNATEFSEIRDVAVSYIAKKTEIDAQSQSFISGVEKILNAYSTLAPALKAWPALWDLLSDEVKAKHKEIVDRKKSEVVEVDVDLSQLTSAVVAHKLGA